MSALLPKADIAGRQLDVRFVPKGDLSSLHSITLSARVSGVSEWRVAAGRDYSPLIIAPDQ